VIVEFKLLDFKSDMIGAYDPSTTFWTDSNGLEMQNRTLNYRPTWDLQANYNDSLENVTANYYPINSAIMAKQWKDGAYTRQFTVSNDRPQAGSSLAPGAFQFMQHRRIPADDQRGMGEYVNELNEVGKGIRVPATYFVEILNLQKDSKSSQRLV
jgi:hypothetical protein